MPSSQSYPKCKNLRSEKLLWDQENGAANRNRTGTKITLRQILSAKTHSERGGIRLHKSESISYASSGVFPIFQSFLLKKFPYSPVFRISFRIAWSINLTRFSSLWRDVWRDADRARPERRRLNEKQKVLWNLLEALWRHGEFWELPRNARRNWRWSGEEASSKENCKELQDTRGV